MGFVSAKPDGKVHKIKLTTRGKDYNVRARTVFVAGR